MHLFSIVVLIGCVDGKCLDFENFTHQNVGGRIFMFHHKSTVVGLAFSSLVFGQAYLATPVLAATSYQEQMTHIYLNGKQVTSAYHIDATDPYSHKPTSWIPIWYLQQTLKKLSVQNNWNGSMWAMTAPSTWKVNMSGMLTSQKPKSSQMAISINHNQFVIGPKIIAPDPWGHVQTTYVPIYYVMEGLKHMGMSYTWDGTNLKITQTTSTTPTSNTTSNTTSNATT